MFKLIIEPIHRLYLNDAELVGSAELQALNSAIIKIIIP
jgi:hypothetical protein